MVPARPFSVPAAPLPAAPPRRWPRRLAVALVLASATAWGLFTWLFYNPFAGDVERLDRLVPASSGFALRGEAGPLLGAPFVKERILARPEVEDLLRAARLDEGLDLLERRQEEFASRLPGFLGGFDLRKDLLGRETVVFGNPGPPKAPFDGARGAVATRMTAKGRLLFSALKHGWVRRRVEAESGLKITRFPLVCEVAAAGSVEDPRWATFWFAVVRDVLVLGNDRELVTESAHLASTGGSGSLPDRPDAGSAFSEDSAAPLRAWLDLARIHREREAASLPSTGQVAAAADGVPGLLGLLLDPDALATVQGIVAFPSPATASVELRGVREAAAASVLGAALESAAVRPAAEALREAALLAPAGSAVAAARLEVNAGALLRALHDRLDPSLRTEIAKGLQESGTSLEDVGRDVDDHLAPGISLVVERLPECDGLDLDLFGANERGEFVLPLPGVLLACRQRGSAGEGGAEAFLRRGLKEWAGRLEGVEDLAGLPAGMRGFRFRPKFLTAEKALVLPAVAFEGDLVLLASNEGTLRRALEAREGKRGALTDFEGFAAGAAACGDGQAFAFVEAGALGKYLKDQRREAATERVAYDPVAERKRIFTEVAIHFRNDQKVVKAADIEAEVDRRMEALDLQKRTTDFDREKEAYVRSLHLLDGLQSLSLGLERDGAGWRLRILAAAAE
jgi:hypothetical protein